MLASTGTSPMTFNNLYWLGLTGGLALVALLSVDTTQTAHAQDGSPELTGEAADLYTDGRKQYERGKYERAADTLRRAYDAFEHPILLYNIALADWRSGSYDRALRVARRAQSRGISQELRPNVDGMIRGLEAHQRVEDIADRSAEASRTGRTASRRGGAGSRGVSAVTWAGVTMGVLSATSFGGAIWMDRRVASLEGELQSARRSPDRSRYQNLNDRITRTQRTGLVFLGSGVVLLGTGTFLLVSELTTESGPFASESAQRSDETRPRHAPRLHPVVHPRGFALHLLWF